jgi:dihydrofolate reductase
MATTVAEMTMSLDGFVADPQDGVAELFGWYGDDGPWARDSGGDVEVPTARAEWSWKTTEASAAHLRELLGTVGAVVAGRRFFGVAGGWKGGHPLGVPVFVDAAEVPDGWPRQDTPATTFVASGLAETIALAREAAGDGIVGVGGARTAQRALELGLLDEVRINLVPVLLGEGIRFFDAPAGAPVRLAQTRVIAGHEVTHLYYRVVR